VDVGVGVGVWNQAGCASSVTTQPAVGDGVGVLKWLTLNVSVGAAGGGVDPPSLPKMFIARRIRAIVTNPDPRESQVYFPVNIAFITIPPQIPMRAELERYGVSRGIGAILGPVARDGGAKNRKA
jgi:hypothetical protein